MASFDDRLTKLQSADSNVVTMTDWSDKKVQVEWLGSVESEVYGLLHWIIYKGKKIKVAHDRLFKVARAKPNVDSHGNPILMDAHDLKKRSK